MCGIAGKVLFSNSDIHPRELETMSQKIVYRGPDDQGIYISSDKKVGLANRRLAIIDLSPKGHQPMSYMDRYWITFNGEIYNFQEEREILEKEGYHFHSDTDTEVILALYDKYGTGCLKFLRGMFAFAIYDEREKTLFLARDRIGKKPLKYFLDGQVFIFASELKAILTQNQVQAVPDWTAIHNYLTYGFVPDPNTGFLGIKKLEPGHYLFVDIAKKKVKNVRYWKPDFSEKLQLSEDKWCEKILETLEESTKLRMIADVPVGAFLSGGVDSSGVVATMARFSTKPIKTFTIVFKEEKYSEKSHARRIANMYSADHNELLAIPESIEEMLPKLVYQYEEPYADSSAVITYMISKLAHNFVTVVLTGDGGDENFAGYDHRMRRLQRDITFDKFKWLESLATPISSFLADTTKNAFFERVEKFLKKSNTSLADRYVSYNSFFSNNEKDLLYSNELKKEVKNVNSLEIARRNFNQPNISDRRDRALFLDLVNWLPGSQMTKVDIASMSVSLETRSPFLDYKMIEIACQIPFELKVRNNEYKYILKKALEKIVPKENLYRKKIGFTIPLDKWFTGSLNKFAKAILFKKDSLSKKFLNEDYIKEMLEKHSERDDFGPKLWSLLTLELWFKTYFG